MLSDSVFDSYTLANLALSEWMLGRYANLISFFALAGILFRSELILFAVPIGGISIYFEHLVHFHLEIFLTLQVVLLFQNKIQIFQALSRGVYSVLIVLLITVPFGKFN